MRIELNMFVRLSTLLFLVSAFSFDCRTLLLVTALSSPQPQQPEVMPRQFIQLTNPIGGVEQSLPASFVQNWPTWVLNKDGCLHKIPDDEGFVSPASIDELWQPVDLKRPELRLALGFHIRGGIIRHVMPAVDLSYPGGLHRNRGMSTVPRAHAWIDFTNSLDEWEKYTIVLSQKKKDEKTWTQLSSSSSGKQISSAIERAMVCLADAPADIGDGSHILHVLLDGGENDEGIFDTIECPSVGHELRVIMDDDDFLEDQAEAAPGILQVLISASMAGSESEYLPEVYKELFHDESLRNPLYAKFKKRQENRK